MSDQWVSMIVGAGVVIALRLLDWAFPRGYIWRRVKTWSEPIDDAHDEANRENRRRDEDNNSR
jgi:hypothetical protein